MRDLLEIDFLEPKGDPGLSGPGSVSWRVMANPVISAVGGVAAVILELAEPAVRAGVWDHSIFKSDPIGRGHNTRLASMAVTYGPRVTAQRMFDRVTRMHQRVAGDDHRGVPYRAMDPDLLTFVHVTAVWGFLNAFVRYGDPELSAADRDRYYAEAEAGAKGFGALSVPTSEAAIDAYLETVKSRLYANDTINEFLTIVSTTSPIGAAGRPFQRMIARAAIDLLPPDFQTIVGLTPAPPVSFAPQVRAMARLARFAQTFTDGPPQQACRRMGVSTACLS